MAKNFEWQVDEELLSRFENDDADREVEECFKELEKLKWQFGGNNI